MAESEARSGRTSSSESGGLGGEVSLKGRSVDCFRLGWSMRADADFFCLLEHCRSDKNADNKPAVRDRWVGKVNFVEIRSFLHTFRSFDRRWSFFILCLQAMIIVAWNMARASSIFTSDVFKKVLSVFITAAILKLGQDKASSGSNIGHHGCAYIYLSVARILSPCMAFILIEQLFGGLFYGYPDLIRKLGMLRSRFQSLPGAFNACLIPEEKSEQSGTTVVVVGVAVAVAVGVAVAGVVAVAAVAVAAVAAAAVAAGAAAAGAVAVAVIPSNKEKEAARFAQLWNKIISSFREEDLISNREMDLLLVPYWADRDLELIQWPPFLLASKIPIALDMAKDSNGKYKELKKRIEADNYMSCAVCESYASFRNIIKFLVQGDRETLDNKQEDRDQVVILFQDMLEVVTRDIMMEDHISSLVDSIRGGYGHEGITPLEQQYQLFASSGAIKFPITPVTEAWKEKVSKMDFLSLEILVVINHFDCSVLTPYFKEEVLFSLHDFEEPNEDGVSILYYLQKIFPDEWKNFLERVKCYSEEELKESDDLEGELRLWASYRGQTLSRTVRGMMYYRKALKLQAFLDMAKYEDLMEGYKAVELNSEDQSKGERSLWAQCQAVADMKFTYVVSCQLYGIHKRSGDPRAQDILKLMTTYGLSCNLGLCIKGWGSTVYTVNRACIDSDVTFQVKLLGSSSSFPGLFQFMNDNRICLNLEVVNVKGLHESSVDTFTICLHLHMDLPLLLSIMNILMPRPFGKFLASVLHFVVMKFFESVLDVLMMYGAYSPTRHRAISPFSLVQYCISCHKFLYVSPVEDEWKNILAGIERDENTHESELSDSPNDILELRFWASYRGKHWPELAQADLKLTYAVTCQVYGKQKEEQKPQAADIGLVMQRKSTP
ncbi:hypothetical protein FNV43_RR04089 [Rhamnella rubrinervis]|uniref:Uncharacterized protein n=1 Tax=Rhamnella rubrinervis TaxID=2594499 RepID=A0A8K0HKD0_9ROSA|nr:hypothetical protein FNV43_RR04089 [Rhamnella rubrinervis]